MSKVYINDLKDIDEILEYIENNFSDKRKIHTEGVREMAIALAAHYGEDIYKAEIAALFHDMYRGVRVDKINSYIKLLGLDEKYLNHPNLAHGKIAAKVMERDFNITDIDILNAVSYHTTGRENMSTLEKIIYIADAIEPNRTYPKVAELRKKAFLDLDKACYLSFLNTIEYLNMSNTKIDQETILAKEYLEKIVLKNK